MNILYNELAKKYNQRGKSRNGGKKIGNNLHIFYNENAKSYAIQYHWTIILEVKKDSCIINNGGFYTYSTKKHLNRFLRLLGVTLYQDKGYWYVTRKDLTVNYFSGLDVLNQLKAA